LGIAEVKVPTRDKHQDIDTWGIIVPEVEEVGTLQAPNQRDLIWTVHQLGTRGRDPDDQEKSRQESQDGASEIDISQILRSRLPEHQKS
jgi:hypothetical protein